MAGLCVMTFCGDEGLLRSESLRRKLIRFWDREGGGELGGERGVISTDKVGIKDTGVNSGAQSMRVAEERSLDGIEGFQSIPFDDNAVSTSIGLLRPMPVSSETLGSWCETKLLMSEVA